MPSISRRIVGLTCLLFGLLLPVGLAFGGFVLGLVVDLVVGVEWALLALLGAVVAACCSNSPKPCKTMESNDDIGGGLV